MAIFKAEITNKLDWIDIDKNIANRRFSTTRFFFGIPIYTQVEDTAHTIIGKKGEGKVGFSAK